MSQGAARENIATEEVLWCQKRGLVFASMHHPHLNEKGQLEVESSTGTSTLRSHKTRHQSKEKALSFSRKPCTLLSVPFEIAQHWDALMEGKEIRLDYTVLKVQAHTGITLKKSEKAGKIVISVTPEKWFWRLPRLANLSIYPL